MDVLMQSTSPVSLSGFYRVENEAQTTSDALQSLIFSVTRTVDERMNDGLILKINEHITDHFAEITDSFDTLIKEHPCQRIDTLKKKHGDMVSSLDHLLKGLLREILNITKKTFEREAQEIQQSLSKQWEMKLIQIDSICEKHHCEKELANARRAQNKVDQNWDVPAIDHFTQHECGNSSDSTNSMRNICTISVIKEEPNKESEKEIVTHELSLSRSGDQKRESLSESISDETGTNSIQGRDIGDMNIYDEKGASVSSSDSDTTCCVCKERDPSQIQGSDELSLIEWIQCEDCEVNWTHFDCSGLSTEEFQKVKSRELGYKCFDCRGLPTLNNHINWLI